MMRFVLRNWFYPADSLCPGCKKTEKGRGRKEKNRKKRLGKKKIETKHAVYSLL